MAMPLCILSGWDIPFLQSNGSSEKSLHTDMHIVQDNLWTSYFKLFLQLCLSCTSDYCLKRSNLDQLASECGGSRKPFSSETESPWCPLLLCSREKSRGKPVSSAVSTSTPVSNTTPLQNRTVLTFVPITRVICQLSRMQNKASVVVGLSGRNLKDLDLFSKSDPYVIISR